MTTSKKNGGGGDTKLQAVENAKHELYVHIALLLTPIVLLAVLWKVDEARINKEENSTWSGVLDVWPGGPWSSGDSNDESNGEVVVSNPTLQVVLFIYIVSISAMLLVLNAALRLIFVINLFEEVVKVIAYVNFLLVVALVVGLLLAVSFHFSGWGGVKYSKTDGIIMGVFGLFGLLAGMSELLISRLLSRKIREVHYLRQLHTTGSVSGPTDINQHAWEFGIRDRKGANEVILSQMEQFIELYYMRKTTDGDDFTGYGNKLKVKSERPFVGFLENSYGYDVFFEDRKDAKEKQDKLLGSTRKKVVAAIKEVVKDKGTPNLALNVLKYLYKHKDENGLTKKQKKRTLTGEEEMCFLDYGAVPFFHDYLRDKGKSEGWVFPSMDDESLKRYFDQPRVKMGGDRSYEQMIKAGSGSVLNRLLLEIREAIAIFTMRRTLRRKGIPDHAHVVLQFGGGHSFLRWNLISRMTGIRFVQVNTPTISGLALGETDSDFIPPERVGTMLASGHPMVA